MTTALYCQACANKVGPNTCLAFPDGIPDEILYGETEHAEPYPGDNGIQFEPVKEPANAQR